MGASGARVGNRVFHKSLIYWGNLVGTEGFEPSTPCTPCI